MTKREFYDYRGEFLNIEDVKKLEAYGIESAEDAHDGENIGVEQLESIGRDFVLEQIQIGDITFDDLEIILDRQIKEEERKIWIWRF